MTLCTTANSPNVSGPHAQLLHCSIRGIQTNSFWAEILSDACRCQVIKCVLVSVLAWYNIWANLQLYTSISEMFIGYVCSA